MQYINQNQISKMKLFNVKMKLFNVFLVLTCVDSQKILSKKGPWNYGIDGGKTSKEYCESFSGCELFVPSDQADCLSKCKAVVSYATAQTPYLAPAGCLINTANGNCAYGTQADRKLSNVWNYYPYVFCECEASCGEGQKISLPSGSCSSCVGRTWTANNPQPVYPDKDAYQDEQSHNHTMCKTCPSGHVVDKMHGSTTCTACPAGQHSYVKKDHEGSAEGMQGCTSCASGTYSSDAASSCTSCASGTYSSDAASSCTSCGTGQYNEEQGQTICKDCDTGKYSGQEGQITCDYCGTGKYNGQQGKSSCKSCSTGKYNDQLKQSSCTPCGTGKYNGQQGQNSESSCKDCDTGKYNDQQGKTSESSCQSCGIGKYNDQQGQSSCTPCGTGKYNGQLKQSSCTPCDPDMYMDEDDQSSCKDNCNAGSYINSDKSACLNCIEGQYQDQDDQLNCKDDCRAGSYINSDKTACKNCGPGKYQNEPDKSTCIDCPKGYSSSSGGAENCDACSSSYQDQQGQSSCKSCAAGSSINVFKTACSHCDIGQYQNETDQNVCKSCAAGSSINVAKTACSHCDIGQYQDQNDQTGCVTCSEGQYQNDTGKLTCLPTTPCTSGKYINNEPTISSDRTCTTCAAGKYGDGQRQSCITCTSGQYQDQSGQSTCITTTINCVPGTFIFQSEIQKSVCRQCPTGLVSIINATGCRRCRYGTSSNGKTCIDDCGVKNGKNACKSGCNSTATGGFCVAGTCGTINFTRVIDFRRGVLEKFPDYDPSFNATGVTLDSQTFTSVPGSSCEQEDECLGVTQSMEEVSNNDAVFTYYAVKLLEKAVDGLF